MRMKIQIMAILLLSLAIEQSRVGVKDEKADPYNFFREYVRLERGNSKN